MFTSQMIKYKTKLLAPPETGDCCSWESNDRQDRSALSWMQRFFPWQDVPGSEWQICFHHGLDVIKTFHADMHVLWQLYNWWLPSLTRCFPALAYLAQREDHPLSQNTHTHIHTQQRRSGCEHFLLLWSRRQQTVLQYKQKLCWAAAALEVPAGVNVNFKPVLNMTHLRFLRQEIISHWRLCTEEFSLSRLFVSLFPPFLPLSRLFFFCCLCERSEGAAGGSPKGHSVKWTQLWPPRHPRHSQSDHFSPTHRAL